MKSKFNFLYILLVLITVSAAGAAAEDRDAFTEYPNALGGFYGEIGGTGLSYQRWFGKLGVHTAFGLLYTEEDTFYMEDAYSPESVTQTPFTYNLGAEVAYRVYSDSYLDWFDGCLYVFAGAMHTGNFVTTYNYEQTAVDVGGVDTYAYKDKSGPAYVPVISPGFGIGLEFVFFNHLSIPFEFGLMGAWALGSIMPIDAGLKVQAGLRYRY